MTNAAVLSALARCFASGDPSPQALATRAALVLGRPWFWLEPLARRFLRAHNGQCRPRRRDIVQFLQHDPALTRRLHRLTVAQWVMEPPRMQPVPAARSWGLPELVTPGDLAEWLQLTPSELEWFVDALAWNGASPKLDHYHRRILEKKHGGVRLIEAPKPRLKALQRQILSGILDRVPAHPAVHGFRKGRSIVSFAGPHAGKPLLLRMDLEDFFPSVPAARIQAAFRTLGYPEEVAGRLTGLCTVATPRSVWRASPQSGEVRALYGAPHLPQGAPASPALANLCAYRADCRLSGLARSFGAEYTRYADDLAFSFNPGVDARRFPVYAAVILLEEGFSVNHHKTRVLGQGQQQRLAGLVTMSR